MSLTGQLSWAKERQIERHIHGQRQRQTWSWARQTRWNLWSHCRPGRSLQSVPEKSGKMTILTTNDQAPDKRGISALMNSPQKSSIKNKKNKTKMKQGETWSSRSDGLQPNVRITLSRERERDIIHEDEDSISSWKPIQIYKSFHTVRTRFTQKPSNYIWLLSNPVKALSFNFPTTCPSSSVDIAPPPPLKNQNQNLVLKRKKASEWRERFR